MNQPKINFTQYLLFFVKGMLMGVADAIPGISGGSIAFITGIYQQWIDALKSLRIGLLQVLLQKGVLAFVRESHLIFLSLVFGGIAVSLKLFSGILLWLLEQYPVMVWSLFLGLMVSAAFLVLKVVCFSKRINLLLAVIGLLIGIGITLVPFVYLPKGPVYLYFSGLIAICAMMLPGISGSFLLVILGLYETVLTAVKELDLRLLLIFGLGCITGLLLFSRFLSWMFRVAKEQTIALLGGLIVGSLYKLWPWQMLLEQHPHSGQKMFLIPSTYESMTGKDASLMIGIVCFIVGLCVPWGIHWFVLRLRSGSSARSV